MIYENNNESFQSICFSAILNGWSAGGTGLILNTKDGGLTWETQNSNTLKPINKISFIDNSLGWACGNSGVLINTQDGGENWTVQNSFTSKNLYGVDFTNESFGWLCGDEGSILHTDNGGAVSIRNPIEYISESIIHVYPNPSIDRVNLEFSEGVIGDIIIDLYQGDGRLVERVFEETYKTPFKKYTFYHSGLPPGIYFLKVSHNKKTHFKKLIIN